MFLVTMDSAKTMFKNNFNFKIITLSATIYYLGIIIGFYNYSINSDSTILKVGIKYKGLSYYSNLNLISILSNNIFLTIQLIIGSALFGIPTFSSLIYNGIFFGILLANSIESKATISEILLLTLPHGIFEIPAIIIAGAAGFKIPYEIVRYLAGKKDRILTKEDIKEYLTLALISIILIVIAAWIEANVTLKIAKAMLSKGI